jgi:hypothetical protein
MTEEQKRRGPKPGPRKVRVDAYLPEELGEWLREQPNQSAAVQAALEEYRARREARS